MSLDLRALLTLVGRLDDTPGTDTPRERFRRFVNEQATSVADLRRLLEESHGTLGDQMARARQDLVLALGRVLGFDVSYGAYQSHPGAIRLEGHWRSRRRARVALEVRDEFTTDADVDTLERTVGALNASAADESGERWVGLCVTTPFYAAARRLERHLAQGGATGIRCISLESLLWLAEASADGRVGHDDVVRLLTSGPDSDFMVDLMRRLSESSARPATQPSGQAAAAVQTPPGREASGDPPRLSIVARPDREPARGFWLAALVDDENATPEQLFDAVIARRRVLGIGEVADQAVAAREGDSVCFVIAGAGVVGHAQLDAVVSDASTTLRGADRFSAVFRLRDLVLLDVPRPVVDDEIVARAIGALPTNAPGAFLSPLSKADFERLTDRRGGSAIAARS